MIGGQICYSDETIVDDEIRSLDRARKFYQRGIENCPTNHTIWTLASRLEESSAIDSVAGSTKARSVLELSRRQNPKCAELWLEAVRLERRSGIDQLAETLMAKALQECPTSGILWAETIATAPRVQQKSKATDAIKRCPEDPHVIAAVATFFASERKHDKARKWFDRAVVLNPDLGDSWARYYAFEKQRSTNGDDDEVLSAIRKRCERAAPKHGEIWAPQRSKSESHHKKMTIAEGLEIAAQQILLAKTTKR